MMAERHTTRRAFLAAFVVSAGAASVGAVKLLGGGETRREELTGRVAGAFEDLRAAKAVGAAYLRSHPGDADERRLVRELRRSNRAWSAVAAPADVRRLARAQARRDYAAGRLAIVDGWYLSRTEARLCALTTFA
jgi:hypothetical protein